MILSEITYIMYTQRVLCLYVCNTQKKVAFEVKGFSFLKNPFDLKVITTEAKGIPAEAKFSFFDPKRFSFWPIFLAQKEFLLHSKEFLLKIKIWLK